MYHAAHSAIKAHQAWEAAAAAGETAVMATAQNWAGIALAAGVAATVVASFEAGYHSRDLHVNTPWHTPQGRRIVRRSVAG